MRPKSVGAQSRVGWTLTLSRKSPEKAVFHLPGLKLHLLRLGTVRVRHTGCQATRRWDPETWGLPGLSSPCSEDRTQSAPRVLLYVDVVRGVALTGILQAGIHEAHTQILQRSTC